MLLKGKIMAARLIAGFIFGALSGALLGYFGKCVSGSCPLTANPLRGAFFGAIVGVFFVLLFANFATGFYKEKDIMVIKIGSRNAFEKVKNSKGIFLVDFYGELCQPCRMLLPVLEKLAEKYEGRAAFYKVDAAEFGDLAGGNGVEVTPTVLIFKDGKEAERLTGLRGEAEYSRIIDRLSEQKAGE
jgi:thioredoxin 1